MKTGTGQSVTLFLVLLLHCEIHHIRCPILIKFSTFALQCTMQPGGGITKGQTFRAQTKQKSEESSTLFRIPIGLWKDGLGDFCKYGPCHSSFLCSCLFPLISLGQIYTRLDLRWDGTPYHLPPQSPSSSFKIMLLFTFVYVLSKQIIESMMMSYHYLWILNLIYMITITALVGRTRRHLREKYDIPATFTQLRQSSPTFDKICGGDGHGGDDDYGGEGSGVVTTCCGEVEDYALAACCYPCVVSQMNRHTAMFDTYEGSCFSSNGLPPHAPEMI